MISLVSLTAAIRRALDNETAAKTEHQKFIARKRHLQEQAEIAWREEQAHRAERAADADGAIAAAKIAKAEQQQQERLDELAASIANWQRKHF